MEAAIENQGGGILKSNYFFHPPVVFVIVITDSHGSLDEPVFFMFKINI